MTWVIIVLIIGGCVFLALLAGLTLGRGAKVADAHEQQVRQRMYEQRRQGA